MVYEPTTHKFAIVVNRTQPVPALMNAVAHLSIGLGADLGTEAGGLPYAAPRLGVTSTISTHPVIILEARSSTQLLNLIDKAKAVMPLRCALFATSMLGASAADQQARTQALDPATAEIMAVGVFGPRNEVDAVVKKFSLFKAAATSDVVPVVL